MRVIGDLKNFKIIFKFFPEKIIYFVPDFAAFEAA